MHVSCKFLPFLQKNVLILYPLLRRRPLILAYTFESTGQYPSSMSALSQLELLLWLDKIIWFDTLDEPYKVEIADSNLVNTYGVGLVRAKINKTSQFTVDVQKAGAGHVTVNIAGRLFMNNCVLLGKILFLPCSPRQDFYRSFHCHLCRLQGWYATGLYNI